MNTFFSSREKTRYVEKSMINMIMTNDKRMFENVKNIPTVSLDLNHRMVLRKITWKGKTKPRKKIKERYCLEGLREEGVMETFDEEIKRKYEEMEEQENVEDSWKVFKTGVNRTAEGVLGKKRTMGDKRKKTACGTRR